MSNYDDDDDNDQVDNNGEVYHIVHNGDVNDDNVNDNGDDADYIEEVWRLSIQSRPRST